ncbi:single-stranded DNA-binding protein [Lacticaseibacillus paracasei subsp. paracasei Lpp125]|uniref:single-stranded DNA-binding protein n=1 Tax=Lacticaseibacillus paracasei TaxID=1597 RepID=UPI0003436B40|nr:single-stranded DNA-binding protein [Lacticaseibacillus paracasei]EPD01575.1 single-stranded DNA-binding protein [Lacticaseibacillus paracasei subsp. paracasei Lpp125]
MNNFSGIGRIATDVKKGNGSATAILAVHRIYSQAKDKQTADFIPIVAFGKMAEVLNNYAPKGTRIGISGHIHTGQYEKDGRTEYTWQVVAEHIYLLSNKPHNDASPKLSDASLNILNSQLMSASKQAKVSDDELPF